MFINGNHYIEKLLGIYCIFLQIKRLPQAPLSAGFCTDPPLENVQNFRKGGSVRNYCGRQCFLLRACAHEAKNFRTARGSARTPSHRAKFFAYGTFLAPCASEFSNLILSWERMRFCEQCMILEAIMLPNQTPGQIFYAEKLILLSL